LTFHQFLHNLDEVVGDKTAKHQKIPEHPHSLGSTAGEVGGGGSHFAQTLPPAKIFEWRQIAADRLKIESREPLQKGKAQYD
jgi:hypothetical protein